LKLLLAGLALLAFLPSAVSGQVAGTEFQVNTHTTSLQTFPALSADANGDFVVVWQSLGQDGSSYGVFGQRFSAAGARRGSEFQANTYVTSYQSRPAVASDANGNFIVVWQSSGQEGSLSSGGVFGRRFSAAGVPQAAEFQVNTYTTSLQYVPAVAADAAGDFVVVWDSFGQDGAAYGVFGQRFNASGARVGAEFRVNSFTTSLQRDPAVAADANGNFVVVWTSSRDADGSYGVFAQRFNSSGAPQGPEFRVNSYTTGNQSFSAVASDAGGNFVVVWTSLNQDGNLYGIFGQRFNASGVPQGGEFLVNSTTVDNQIYPAVSSDANGNFVVAWQGLDVDGTSFGVFGRRFNASGLAQGTEFLVNSYTTNFQRRPAIASNPDGDFVVAWQSYGQDEPISYGIFGQRYGDLLFEDGFDSGGLTRWSSASTDGADLSANGAAALAGTSFGLQAVVNDTNSLFVQDDTPNAESRYRARFYFDPNGFDPGESQSHFRTRILIAQGSGFRVITLVLKRQLGAYTVEARVRRNDGTRADTGFFPISDGSHFIEFDWRRATGPGANDGSLELFVDGGSVATLTGIDNDQVPVDFVRMGALSVKTGAAGTLFYDQFESRRQNLIGPE
jgi:hypothetical protein